MVPLDIHCMGIGDAVSIQTRHLMRFPLAMVVSCHQMTQVMCLKESRKLLAYLEKEFGKAQPSTLGEEPFFVVVLGLHHS